MAAKVTPVVAEEILHPNVVVEVFRHAHAKPAEHGGGDRDRILSPVGTAQAEKLARILEKDGADFDQIIASAAPRAQQTAAFASMHSKCIDWYMGRQLQLYSAASIQDHRALLLLEKEIERMFKAKEIETPMPYAMYRRADTTGIFDRFMAETRAVVSTIPRITVKRRIAIFGHAVMGNAIVEAFFPQHAAKLATIELAPCDRIRVTGEDCVHIPFPLD